MKTYIINGSEVSRLSVAIHHLLTALLDENTTMAEIMQVISSVQPDAFNTASAERHEAIHRMLESILVHVTSSKPETLINSNTQPPESMIDADSEETRRNAMSMFHQPTSKS
ncbi:hypothetical protein Q9R34_17455 [Enterobacter sp. BRE11]|nr:hypothetical protein [Enterobacter sp. BRE11]